MNFLFYFVIALTFLRAFLSKLIHFLYDHKLQLQTSVEYMEAKKNLKEMLDELSKISMTDEWAKYAKLQRRINKENEKLNKFRHEAASTKQSSVAYITKVGNYALTAVIIVMISYDRSAVVAQIPENWLSWPLRLFCWSATVPGGVTVPCWVLLSSRAASTFASL